MIYVAIVTGIIMTVACWAICASIPHDPAEDEEQEKYLKKWKEKYGSGKKEHRTDTDGV